MFGDEEKSTKIGVKATCLLHEEQEEDKKRHLNLFYSVIWAHLIKNKLCKRLFLIIRIYYKNISWINPKRWVGFLIRSRNKTEIEIQKNEFNQTIYKQQMVRLHRWSHPMREAAALRLPWLSEAGGGEADLYEQS